MNERSLTDSHGQAGVLLTLSAVRSRRHSYHSQADSAGSIPVTRSKREKRCSTSESDCISQAGQRSFASETARVPLRVPLETVSSQADSAASIPATRSKREKRYAV